MTAEMWRDMTKDADTSLGGCHVLLVEDEYLIAADLAEALQELGAIILGPTASVKGALDLIFEADPNLAVLDVNLRQENVYPLADALRARGVPFIFTTGYSSDVIPERFQQIPRCQKPVQAAMVARLLTQQLDR
jgi:CheY-like chemotaxis protein